jgi:hypothetical protein
MSFAEDFGHDIPDYDDWGRESEGSGIWDYAQRGLNLTAIVECLIVTETDKAWLIEVERDKEKMTTWAPKSKCVYNKDHGAIAIPTWLYVKLEFKEV